MQDSLGTRPKGTARAPQPLDDDAFQAAVKALIDDAERHADANWRPERERGWERYKGKVEARAEEGGDTTVAYEVRDAVQQVMPEVMEQLAGSEEPIEYYSKRPDQADACRQATGYALAAWWEGQGWTALYDAVMHAAVGRIGVLKVFRHEKLCMEEEREENIPFEQMEEAAAAMAAGALPGYTLLEREDLSEAIADPMTGEMVEVPMVSSATIRRYYVEATLRIEAPDPAEIICTQTCDEDEALCIGQRSTVRMGDLRAMGFSYEELEAAGIDGWDDQARDERHARNDEASEELEDYGSWALRPVDLYEVYVRIDQDGDGLLERWKVIAAGADKTVLRDERVVDQPYVLFPFRRSPHTIQGLSIPDLISDVQEVKTKLMRGMVDNNDLVNNPMMLASGTVNWAQLQTWRRSKVVDERVPGSVRWFAPPPTAADTLPVLEYLSGQVEQRLGAGRAAQGLQPDQLTSVSAVAVAGAQAAAQRAMKLTVRTIAELGLRSAFQKLLRLLLGEPERAVVGQSGEYQLVDPHRFDPTWGVRVRVGLGAMALEERKAAYRELIGLVAQLVAAPGLYGRLTSPSRVALLLQAAVGEFRGLGAGRFFASAEEMQQLEQAEAQQGPPPDPKMVEAQGKLELERQKAQGRGQLEAAKLQGQMQMQAAKLQGDMQAKQSKAWADLQAKLAAIQSKERVDVYEINAEIPLEREKIRMQSRGGDGNLARSRR